jgi:hypothetical protein
LSGPVLKLCIVLKDKCWLLLRISFKGGVCVNESKEWCVCHETGLVSVVLYEISRELDL